MSMAIKQYTEALEGHRVGEDGIPVLVNKRGIPYAPSLATRLEGTLFLIILKGVSFFSKK